MMRLTLNVEQIGNSRKWVRDDWHFLKRLTSRKMRRLAKRYLDEDPKKARYSGWAA